MKLLYLLLLQRCRTHITPLCPLVTMKNLSLALALTLIVALRPTLTLTLTVALTPVVTVAVTVTLPVMNKHLTLTVNQTPSLSLTQTLTVKANEQTSDDEKDAAESAVMAGLLNLINVGTVLLMMHLAPNPKSNPELLQQLYLPMSLSEDM